MSEIFNGLDLSDVTEQGSPVPDGKYAVCVTQAELKATSTGGLMVKVQLKITEGQPQAGRVVFDQFNIKNASAEAQRIGKGQLKGLMKNFGHADPNSLKSMQELIGLKGTITVKVKEDGYGPQSRVTSYGKLATVGGTDSALGVASSPSNPF